MNRSLITTKVQASRTCLLASEISVMKKLPAFNELPSLIEVHKKRIDDLDVQITDVKDFNEQVSQEEIVKVDKEFNRWKMLYRQRMRKYRDVRDALMGEEATKEDLANKDEEFGIDELDEESQVMLSRM
ncbi:hypothetical protein E3P99_02109 [Wallemia hederae]|uniref:Uncharacterized protein n=1 Tax=Wallemia hederae TaxID=1540922 RepID=A0A4T0FNE4_9BASI|nr:hypothetical protein E3P99_02109 [Wallemia hederae]